MNILLNFIQSHIFFITFIVCFWFYADCVKHKRFITDLVEKILFIIFTYFLASALHGQFNGVQL